MDFKEEMFYVKMQHYLHNIWKAMFVNFIVLYLE